MSRMQGMYQTPQVRVLRAQRPSIAISVSCHHHRTPVHALTVTQYLFVIGLCRRVHNIYAVLPVDLNCRTPVRLVNGVRFKGLRAAAGRLIAAGLLRHHCRTFFLC
eukprot:4150748-Amphidinium_carterae.1